MKIEKTRLNINIPKKLNDELIKYAEKKGINKTTAIVLFLQKCIISIHTFRVEGDIVKFCLILVYKYFNPHLPCGR